MSSSQNYYDILEIQSDATPDEIKHAYRRIVKRVHPDTRVEGDTAVFHSVQAAYETLSDENRRSAYDETLGAFLRPRARAAFKMGVRLSQARLRPLADPQMLYVLLDITTASHIQIKHPDLNLCIALDHSLSMDGARLLRAQEAAQYLVGKLRANDYVSIVAFSDRARVVLSGQRGGDRSVAATSVGSIQPWGGTELLQGLNGGLEQLRLWRSASTVDHLILITDGQTYGDEAQCVEAARQAGQEKIGLTLLGLGSDWNDQLLDEMASVSGGYATYVDSPSRLMSVFEQRFKELSNITARDLRLTITPGRDSEIAGAFRLTPDIARLSSENGQYLLGGLEYEQAGHVLLEIRTVASERGRAKLAKIALSGEVLHTRSIYPDAKADIAIDVADDPLADVPPSNTFAQVLERVAVFKVQEKALAEAARGEQKQATARLRHLATHLMDLGNVELAKATMREAGVLARTGQLSADGRKQIHYGTRGLGAVPIGKADE